MISERAGCTEGETRIDVYTFTYKRRLFNGEGLAKFVMTNLY